MFCHQTLSVCGDGYVNAAAGESCDTGGTESDSCANCRLLTDPPDAGVGGVNGGATGTETSGSSSGLIVALAVVGGLVILAVLAAALYFALAAKRTPDTGRVISHPPSSAVRPGWSNCYIGIGSLALMAGLILKSWQLSCAVG